MSFFGLIVRGKLSRETKKVQNFFEKKKKKNFNVLGVYRLRLRLLTAAAEPQRQVFYEKFHFQNMSKKNHKVKKTWKK